MVTVTANVDRCCGSGNCVLAAPSIFDQSQDNGLVIVLQGSLRNPSAELAAALTQAAAICPTQAITLTPDHATPASQSSGGPVVERVQSAG